MLVFYPGIVFWLVIGSALQVATANARSALDFVTQQGKVVSANIKDYDAQAAEDHF